MDNGTNMGVENAKNVAKPVEIWYYLATVESRD